MAGQNKPGRTTNLNKENEMAQITVQATEKTPQPAAARKVSRLFFIDHLRAALIILVVLHHLAAVYGGAIPFYYLDPPQSADSLSGLLLLVFAFFNQAWFMGALFLIAGYFTPGSYERKGSGSFLKDRLLRLGIPLILFYFLINPISSIGIYLGPVPQIPDALTWQSYWQAYPTFFEIGISWFLALLLIFSFGYAAWRWLTRNRPSTPTSESAPPSYLWIGIFILLLATVTYLLRIIIPIGKEMLGIPTLSYLPQYLSFFIAGAVAYRRDWFLTVTDRMGKVGFVTATVVTLVLFPIILMGILGGTFRFLGNGSWPSAVYALWDSTFAVGMVLAAITFFRHYFNGQSKLGSYLAQQSYAVYVIHMPIVVFMAYALRGIALGGVHFGPMLKFGLMAVIVVPICFVVAWVIRQIPGVSRVL
jgi:peptidoglycan/LPS O-acetylase OafA/YrhL